MAKLWKPLHLANCLKELNQLAFEENAHETAISTDKDLFRVMQRLNKEAQQYENDGDQEIAYVLCVRCFEIFRHYKESNVITKDCISYIFNTVIHKQCERYDRLHDLLKQRYYEWIHPKEFYCLINKNLPCLLLDIRKSCEFAVCHVNSIHIINLNVQNSTLSFLSNLLLQTTRKQQQTQYETSGDFQIIIIDNNSMSLLPLNRLRQMLLSLSEKLNLPLPRVLNGGMNCFVRNYPVEENENLYHIACNNREHLSLLSTSSSSSSSTITYNYKSQKHARPSHEAPAIISGEIIQREHLSRTNAFKGGAKLDPARVMPETSNSNKNESQERISVPSSSSASSSSYAITLKRTNSQPVLNETFCDDENNLPSSSQQKQHQYPCYDTNNFNLHDLTAHQLKKLRPSYGQPGKGLTGLRNLGNTCYLNCILQALSNTPIFIQYFVCNEFVNDLNVNNPLGHGGKMAQEFAVLIKALWSNKYTEISPYGFKQFVDRSDHIFSGSDQQDSQEFLLFVLDGLHEDLNKVIKRPTLKPLVDKEVEAMSDNDFGKLSWIRYLSINSSIIVNSFQGQLKSTLTCCTCEKRSVTFDVFMYLSLPVKDQHQCSLIECMNLFLQEEKMTGSCQWKCPTCKVNRDAIKKIDLWKLPQYLIIHLKRFSSNGHFRQKLNTAVNFSLDELNMTSFVPSSNKQFIYSLYSVSNHFGRMESGHYTAYCRNALTKKWYIFDDECVSSMPSNEVKSSAAYILFYELVKTTSRSNG